MAVSQQYSIHDFLACIVVYEQAIENCVTLNTLANSLQEQYCLEILLYDNSQTVFTGISAFKIPGLQIHYIHDPSNPGVSKAYNRAAQIAVELKKKWLILFDQDTFVNKAFLPELIKCINENPGINIFSAIVESHGRIISPAIISPFWQRPGTLKKVQPGIHVAKRFTLINSSMVVSCIEFDHMGGYDEDLKLDFSDHYFFYKFKKINKSFFIIPVVNGHNLSSFAETDYLKAFKRFAMYYSSAFVYSLKIKNKIPVLWAFLRALKLSLKYKKISFLKYAVVFRK
jgi:rhamnosyltransferase